MDEEASTRQPLYRYTFGTAEFDEARFELRVNQRLVEAAQRKPLDLLALLLRHPKVVFSQAELLERLWVGQAPADNTVATTVSRLRKWLGPNKVYLQTKWSVGYRFREEPRKVVVGHRKAGMLALRPGDSVPLRPSYRLRVQLGGSGHAEAWLAEAVTGSERRVYKFSVGDDGVTALKRQAALAIALRSALGPREDLEDVLDQNFETAPFFLGLAYGGQNLAEWASEDGGRLLRMAPSVRLKVFQQVCQAIAAAHDSGVLHKDIKPTNVVVRGEPTDAVCPWRARVIDFGSGRLDDPVVAATLRHEFGVTLNAPSIMTGEMLTPMYLAPEVVGGAPAMAAADVFALGCLLFHLASGDLARSMATGWERAVIDPLVRDDIARATDRDPARRFASARELLNSLDRLAERRRIAARRARAVQRVKVQEVLSTLRDVERAIEEGRKAVLAAVRADGSTSALALLARMRLASDLAAASQFDESAACLDEVAADMSGLGDTCTKEHWARLWWARSNLQAYRLQLHESLASVDQAVHFLEDVSDPTLADAIRTRLGHARRMLGDYGGAEAAYRELIAIQEARDGDEAETTLQSHVSLSRSLIFQWRLDEAMTLARNAFERLSESCGTDDLGTQFANDAIASIQFKGGDYEAAAATWKEVVASLARISSRPTDFSVTAQSNVALSFLRAGRVADAEANGWETLRMAKTIFPSDSPRVQSIRYHLANSMLDQEKAEGVDDLLDGLTAEALKKANQADDWEARLAYQRGRLALVTGLPREAIALLEDAAQASLDPEMSGITREGIQQWLKRAREALRQSRNS